MEHQNFILSNYIHGENLGYYNNDEELIVTYLVIINKNNIKNNITNIKFYDISIEDIEAKMKTQKVTLRSNEKVIEYKMITTTKMEKNAIEYIHKLQEKTQINELTAIIIHTGIKRLRNRIENTNIAFSFLEEEFTISELQQVYEIILDKKLISANFRKKIEPMIKKTDKIVKESAYRPSARYMFNEDFIQYWV